VTVSDVTIDQRRIDGRIWLQAQRRPDVKQGSAISKDGDVVVAAELLGALTCGKVAVHGTDGSQLELSGFHVDEIGWCYTTLRILSLPGCSLADFALEPGAKIDAAFRRGCEVESKKPLDLAVRAGDGDPWLALHVQEVEKLRLLPATGA
jgi:hypothetical protein